ncbi:hypothetical protein BFV94_4253 [Alteromonas macleodii]|uniref:Uncharacterized protein n=1 Tax=Alteromonas macleodii TaxID=28108 RepID=A0AB36FSI8_ALTMA|nr:hypothetical protein BFV93_4594 [Alteromonas macleodii]OES25262.1 hypothetical protein BFV95_4473 [Alteromonas macleodii]OES25907.1 hypothetical protein BFV94_4253 [Alteromonas macleodii]OES38763.1 hypothetical protein BFV96_4693 [Alteromonas macleodii]
MGSQRLDTDIKISETISILIVHDVKNMIVKSILNKESIGT